MSLAHLDRRQPVGSAEIHMGLPPRISVENYLLGGRSANSGPFLMRHHAARERLPHRRCAVVHRTSRVTPDAVKQPRHISAGAVSLSGGQGQVVIEQLHPVRIGCRPENLQRHPLVVARDALQGQDRSTGP